MKIKDFIQKNHFRVMGAFSNDSSDIISTNNSRMKAYAAIGKTVSYRQDMESVFGSEPNRQMDALGSSVAALSSPEGRLLNGLFWFMNLTETDAKAFAVLARGGDLLEARKIWKDGEQDMSALQNQLMCCLLMDSRSYSKALQLASTLYEKYGYEFIVTVSNGFEIVTPDKLMSAFLTEIVKASDGKCVWWDKAVKRLGSEVIDLQWTEAKATRHIGKLLDALNVAKTTEIHSTRDNYDIAIALKNQAEPHLKALKVLKEEHPVLLSRYATIADAVCEEILNREIEYYNHSGWFSSKTDRVLALERFCYRYAATIRFKDRCKLNINITMGRLKDAPLFSNGMPDKLISESDRKKRNAGICAILSALHHFHGARTLLFLALFVLLGVGCSPTTRTKKQGKETTKAESLEPVNGIYYWKTVFDLNETELSFLGEHHVKRLYLRLFDVVPVDKSDQYGFDFEVVPNATIAFKGSMPENVEIIPVVYITIDALRQCSNSAKDYAGLIVERVLNIADFHDLGTIREVQLDCDWTQQTQDSYFAFCQAVKDKLKPYGIQLSCTIRLWQLACACPPVDRGVLMLYNTGSVTNIKTRNSILDLDDVQAFLKGKDYGLPLDFAYPVYNWCVWFRNDAYMGLFHDLPVDDNTLFKCDSSSWYTVLRDHHAEHRELKEGDIIRHEYVSFGELHGLDSLVRQKLPSADSASIILYHLDSANLLNYTTDEIRQIYRCN